MANVVFDTVVFVRALISPHGLAGRLVFTLGDRYTLVLSQSLVEEIVTVLHRPALQRKYRSLAGRDLATILSLIAAAPMVSLTELPAVARDPKDDHVLATAKAAGAAFLVSEDLDLLTLDQYAGIPIVTVAVFMQELEAVDAER